MTDPISVTAAATPGYSASGGSGATTTPPVSPPAADPASGHTATPQAADLEAIAATLNQRAQDLQTSLHFQVDHVTGQLVISVIDTRDNRVLMQAPSQEALAIAQSLERLQMQLMRQSA